MVCFIKHSSVSLLSLDKPVFELSIAELTCTKHRKKELPQCSLYQNCRSSPRSISVQIMLIAGKGGYVCCNFNGICVLKLERGVVRGGKCTEALGPLAGDWLCCANRQGFSTGRDGRF